MLTQLSDTDPKEVGLAFVAHHYGEKLADSLRGYLNQKHNDEGKK